MKNDSIHKVRTTVSFEVVSIVSPRAKDLTSCDLCKQETQVYTKDRASARHVQSH